MGASAAAGAPTAFSSPSVAGAILVFLNGFRSVADVRVDMKGSGQCAQLPKVQMHGHPGWSMPGSS